MKLEYNKNFTWDQYFKDVGIYQGRCWHNDIYELLVNVKNKIL